MSWATRYAFTCHNRLLARDFTCDHVCTWGDLFYFFRIYFFATTFFLEAYNKVTNYSINVIWRADFALIYASCIRLYVYVGRWMYHVCMSEMFKFDCKKDDLWNAYEILRMYNSKVRLQLYWFFFTCRF